MTPSQPKLLPQMIISVAYVFAFTSVLYVVFVMDVTWSESQEKMANVLIGILSSGLVTILNFWFGSSSGSKEKTAKLVLPKSEDV